MKSFPHRFFIEETSPAEATTPPNPALLAMDAKSKTSSFKDFSIPRTSFKKASSRLVKIVTPSIMGYLYIKIREGTTNLLSAIPPQTIFSTKTGISNLMPDPKIHIFSVG